MEIKSEKRICQNCSKDFTIEPDDFSFYEKMKVPPPTFCPWCRFIRRMAWRNERALYKRACDLCQKKIVSMYPQSLKSPVYCWDCWNSDKWDPESYGREYDFNRPFFEQFKELLDTVPRFALWQRRAINSEYSNMVGESRNVYLSVSVVKECENVFYSRCVDNSKNIFDSMNVINGSENLYEVVEAQGNYNSQFLLLCRATIDSYYCVDCINCSNCFLSSNLRNKKFCIRNKQYTEKEYHEELAKLNLKSRKARERIYSDFEEIKKKAIYKYGNITRCVNVTGNNILNVKDSKNCFEAYNVENSKHCFRAFDFKDCFDFSFGGDCELVYEVTTGVTHNYNVAFSFSPSSHVRDSAYLHSCMRSSNLFGCVGMRNKEYAIFNKVYPENEYKKLKEQIIEHMDAMPYRGKNGRTYGYGEYFPIEIAPCAYNESAAQEFEILTEKEAFLRGYEWINPEGKNNVTIRHTDIPDNIDDASDKILDEVLACDHEGKCNHRCSMGFRITQGELQFYRQKSIPLPDKCPNCRHYIRFAQVPLPKLYHRKCMCDKENHQHSGNCQNEFETAYAPDRPEKVYCESCYNKEVY